jgi:enoyl-CoA hydratase
MFQISTAGPVTTLTLSHSPVNAISDEWVRTFDSKLDQLGSACSVLHIRSEQKVFCAGADLKEMRARMDMADGPDRMYAYVAGIQRLYFRIEALPQVVLAEIGGAAMGGGLELALACDIRVAALEAKIGLPEVRLGLVPAAGGTQRLTRLCGPGIAKRLILGGELLDGAQAEQLGLVHWAQPRAQLAHWSRDLAARLAESPKAALAANKRCIGAALDASRDGFAEEIAETRQLYDHPETRRKVAEFLGKGKI